ncbi:Serine/threonine protein kinase [Nannocystis exedens]|uniref:Serine/threonine protein kinase n=1 Tax=Nannocystis exedens TaxID=54 RepID=A0A1I1WNT2_9BACT|nr:protein kinase [Nannocystis exedens]PCC67768.1 Serine/threonine-protein kinase PknB [Nannocystis exedens]SFD95073.1 Serine/threonine protein kinase [Nannocystis exedens]
MHSIPIDEDPLPEILGGPIGPGGKPSEVEVLGDLRGHVLAGRYVLTELLGSGDLGCVYSGRDQASNQQVVVKVLAAPEQREVVARIAERARRRLGVRHPCVAAVLAEGTMGGLWYAVMEHAEGKNLYHAEGDPRFEGAGLLKLAAELAEGLATLHALGAPHGAISPGNLVWSSAGVKLVDLDVQAPSHLSEGAEPAASTDVSMLAAVLLEVAGVREDEAPWIAPIARVVRSEARPSAAEWAQQLRNAEIDALKPGIADAARHAEGAIDSAWDQVFESADLPYRPSKGKVTIDTGLHRIEPPPQLAVLSYEVEVEPELPDVKDDEPESEGLSATSLTSLTALVEELEPEVAATPLKPSKPAESKQESKPEARAASKPDSRPAKAASRPATRPPTRPPTAPPMAASPLTAAASQPPAASPLASPSAASPLASPSTASPRSAASQPDAAPPRDPIPVAASPLLTSGPSSLSLSASATAPTGPVTASMTTPATRVEPAWARPAAPARNNTQLAVGLLVIAGLCALIAWRLQAWATAEAPPPPPVVNQPAAPEPSPPAPTAGRSDLSPETSTLARVAQPETPPATPEAAPTPDDELVAVESAGEAPDDVAPGNGGADQLSAGDFRKILLRTNRSQRVRQCYEEHGPGDVEMVALVGRGGKVLKLRMDPGPLSDCLRKVVLRLEFPRADRQAQHNYVFHPPNDAE